jgi:hypothetical protein
MMGFFIDWVVVFNIGTIDGVGAVFNHPEG